MKNLLLIIFTCLCILKLNLIAGNWELVDKYREIIKNDSVSIGFREIGCADNEHCIAFGNFSYGLYPINRITTDGGKSWSTTFRDSLMLSYSPVNVAYPDTNLCLVLLGKQDRDTAEILRSTDKGFTWHDTIKVPCRIGYGFSSVSGEMSLFDKKVGGFTNGIDFFITEDSGLAWEKIYFNLADSITGITIENIFFLDENTIYAIIYSNGILMQSRYLELIKSKDRGKTWEIIFFKIQNFSEGKELWDMYYPWSIVFIDENTGWLCGHGTKSEKGVKRDWVAKTTDGGYSWTTQLDSLGSLSALFRIYFTDSLNGYTLSRRHQNYWWTSDGGNKWTLVDTDELYQDMLFLDLAVPSPDIVYGVAAYPRGFIYKYSSSTDIQENITSVSSVFKIIPNIIGNGESFEIDFSLNEPSKIEILIYTSSGTVIEKSDTYYLYSGSHRIRNSNINTVSTGLYWVKMLINDSEFIIKPLIVIN